MATNRTGIADSSARQAVQASLAKTLRRATILFAFALAVRALHLYAMRDSPLFQVLICDCGQYDAWAQRIAGGEWLGSEVFYQTPLYPYLLAVVYRALGHSVWAVRILQALFGAAACVALARAGAKFFSSPHPARPMLDIGAGPPSPTRGDGFGERVGWLAGILLALYPPAIFFDGILQKASLDLLLMTSLLWVLGAAQERPRARLFALAGLLLGAMALNRENSLVLLPVLAVWIVCMSWPAGGRDILARLAVFALGLAIVLLPVGLRNYHVGRAFLLTTAQMGPNFYIGNHRGAGGGYEPMRAGRGEPAFEALDARLIAEDDLKRPLSSAEVSRYWMARSWQDIQAAPGAWLRLLAWKWFLTWHAIEFVDAEAIHAHARYSPILAITSRVLHFGMLVPLAVLSMWLSRRQWRRLWILYAVALAFASAVTLFYVFARYRYPLVPVVALFAAAGLVGACDRLHTRKSGELRELAVGIFLATLVALASNWPVPQRFNDDAVTFYNTGSTLMAMGRAAEAIDMLRAAEQADPSFPDTYNNLGRALLDQGHVAEARVYFEKAIAADPRQAIFHVNLANTQIKERDQAGAIASLRQAIELDPLLVPAYGPLAELELNHGDADSAVRHLRRAAELQPSAAIPRADLGIALAAIGRSGEAIAELRAALAIDENLLPAAHRLAWLLATGDEDRLRNGAEAVVLAKRACLATGDSHPQLLDTLAAAYAETGQFEKAAETAARAIETARAANQSELAEAIAKRRELYLSGHAYRQP